MGASKPFGYKGKPGTCWWCGNKLRHEAVSATDADQGNPTYKRSEWSNSASIQAPTAGYEQNGFFDTLRCGFKFGVELARLGTQLERDN